MFTGWFPGWPGLLPDWWEGLEQNIGPVQGLLICRHGHLPLGPCAGRTTCGLRLGGPETEYRSPSESLGMQEVGPLADLVVDCGSDGAGAKYKALEAFWGFSWECLILVPVPASILTDCSCWGLEISIGSF